MSHNIVSGVTQSSQWCHTALYFHVTQSSKGCHIILALLLMVSNAFTVVAISLHLTHNRGSDVNQSFNLSLLQVVWLLCVWLCYFLLLQAIQHVWISADISIFWLHYSCLLCIFPYARHCLFLCFVEVYKIYLH